MNWFKINVIVYFFWIPCFVNAQPAQLNITNESFGRLFTSQVFRDQTINTSETTVVVDLSDTSLTADDSSLALSPTPSKSNKKSRPQRNWKVVGYVTQANGELGVWLKEAKTGEKRFEAIDETHWRKNKNQLNARLDGKTQTIKPGSLTGKSNISAVKKYEVH